MMSLGSVMLSSATASLPLTQEIRTVPYDIIKHYSFFFTLGEYQVQKYESSTPNLKAYRFLYQLEIIPD